MLILQYLGASISLLLGLMAVVSPSAVEKFVSIQAIGKLGISEIRATYGGFFLGISIFALYTQEPLVFVSLGFAWLGASFIRLGTFILGSTSRKNTGGIVFEAIIGLLCLASLLNT